MACDIAGDILSTAAECLCSMCKCGNHICPQQYNAKKPSVPCDSGASTIRKCQGEEEKRNRICQACDLPESNLYTCTTYKQDFDAKRSSVRSPLKPRSSTDSLKGPNVTMEKGSTYWRDFVPWPAENKNPYASQHSSDTCANGDAYLNSLNILDMNPRVVKNLCKYYCPPHCVGTKKKTEHENCLIPFKDKFNLGPPSRKVNSCVEKPHEPFEKFTNYKLDYVPHKIEPRKILDSKKTIPHQPVDPSCFDTTQRKDFSWPSERNRVRPEKKQPLEQTPSLKLGEGGPMVKESTNMLDYTDPNVTVRMPIKRFRDTFQPPACRMETETTSGEAYRRWKNVPLQKKLQNVNESHWAPPADQDSRCLVTTYQEDFDGLCAALCPAKMIENYGHKILEPKLHFIGSTNGHDYYQRKTSTAN